VELIEWDCNFLSDSERVSKQEESAEQILGPLVAAVQDFMTRISHAHEEKVAERKMHQSNRTETTESAEKRTLSKFAEIMRVVELHRITSAWDSRIQIGTGALPGIKEDEESGSAAAAVANVAAVVVGPRTRVSMLPLVQAAEAASRPRIHHTRALEFSLANVKMDGPTFKPLVNLFQQMVDDQPGHWQLSPLELAEGVLAAVGDVAQFFVGTYRDQRVAIRRFSSLLPMCKPGSPEYLLVAAVVQHEVALFRQLQEHPRFVMCLGVCSDVPLGSVVLEWMPRGSLYDCLHPDQCEDGVYRSQPVPSCRHKRVTIAMQVAEAVTHLHKLELMHRDLTSKHVLFDDEWNVKLTGASMIKDFSGCFIDNLRLSPFLFHHFKGAVRYQAPELLANDELAFSPECDMYSFGIVLFELFVGNVPWHNLSSSAVYVNLKAKKKIAVPVSVPPPITELIEKCTSYEPSERPTAADALAQLRWMNDAKVGLDKEKK
jgi:hypothetical protein